MNLHTKETIRNPYRRQRRKRKPMSAVEVHAIAAAYRARNEKRRAGK